jgi:hypothetical protein
MCQPQPNVARPRSISGSRPRYAASRSSFDGICGLVVQVLQSALAGLGLDRIGHARDALAGRQARGGAAQAGLHPAGRHQQQRARIVGAS